MQNERPLEVWGGFECSVVRVGNTFRDQVEETGHRNRIEDIAAARALGIKTVRYPVVWETIAPDKPDMCNWTWSDERLREIVRLGMTPILGLLHHGSGPAYTNLLDPNFPPMFARYAQRVAARYPWATLFTPINEPLTTARFSCLYRHWYPHQSNARDFLRAVVNQCKAITLAMRAVRLITPNANLVQTEDLGRVFSTPALSYQAEFENQRRWLSLDLLFGRVGRDHPWYNELLANGIDQRDLALLLEGDGRPDIVGINHYVTSDRYLDEAVHRYPVETHGGNGHHSYADVEAVRVDLGSQNLGIKARLSEAWTRYRSPVVATEVHLGCTREDQVRWLLQTWNAAQELRTEGQDIQAITVWALLGSVDWSSLLLSRRNDYEPGVFDVRSPQPRKTALAKATRSLARRGTYDHPVLDEPGWWRRNNRYFGITEFDQQPCRADARRVIITGSSSSALTVALAELCHARGLACAVVPVADELDTIEKALHDIAAYDAWAVINLDDALLSSARGNYGRRPHAPVFRTKCLAQASAEARIPLIHLSSYQVFDGRLGRPYCESDGVSPDCVAGHHLVAAERTILGRCPDAMLVRAGPLFGLADAKLHSFSASHGISGTTSPTFAPDLFNVMLDLLIDGERGIWHLANRGEISLSAFETWLRRGTIGADGSDTAAGPADVPNFALTSTRGDIMPTLRDAVARFTAGAQGCPEPMRVAAE